MAYLTILPGLLALAGLCTWLVRRCRVPAGLAPLATLSGILLLLLLAGMAGVLGPATLVLLIVGCVLLGREFAAQLRPRQKPACKADAPDTRLLTPGSILFWGGAALLSVRLAWLQPEFTAFDEYSFWGTAAKLTSLYGKLYTVCPSGVPWQMTQTASLPLASWWLQPFGDFAAWRAVLAADILLLAGLAAVVACVEQAGKRVWAPVCLTVLLVPSAFAASGHMSVLCTAWLEFMGDMPAGVLFGAAVAFWLAVRGQKGGVRWLVLPILCLAANLKSNTFVLGLAAAGCIAVDAVCFPPEKAPRGPKAFGGRLGFGLACLAAPAAQYALWNRYTAGLVQQNAAAGGLGDTANVGLPAVAYNGIKILLGGIGENYFEWHRQDLYDYRAAMRTAFWHKSVSIFGAGVCVCAVIGAVFVLAVVLAPTVREKVRTVVLAVCSTACFGGYWLMLLLSYAFLMKDSSPETLVSYARYFSSFYVGWLLLALAMLGRQIWVPRHRFAAHGGVLAAAALTAALTALCMEPQFTVLGVGRGTYAAVRAEYAVAQQAEAALGPDDTLFLVYQGDQGQQWFTYEYALLPRILAYGAGGGTYGTPEKQGDTSYFQPYTRADFAQLVADSGADYLLIVQSDDTFAESYAALFTDGLAAVQQGTPVLYHITPDGWTPFCTLGQEAAV